MRSKRVRSVLRLLATAVLAAAGGTAQAQSPPAGNQPPPPWNCDKSRPGNFVLHFRGDINPGEAQRFKAAWQGCYGGGYSGLSTIDLFSGGGVVTEALAISGLLVEEFRNKPPLLLTRISSGARCVSACTYLFVAGQRRQVEPGGSLEPHGFSGFLGERVDQVMEAIVSIANDKKVPVCKVFEGLGETAWLGRLNMAGKALRKPLADRRLAWALEFLEMPVRNCPELEKKIVAYAKLSPEKMELIAHLDSVTAITMPEVERSAALRAFRTQFAIQAGVMNNDPVPLLDKPERHLRWALDGYADGINAYLDKSGQGARLKDIDSAAEDLRAAHEERIGAATNSAVGQLGSYLNTRRNDVDLPAFVKLMFSTSILYTRPLTREELCDHNLANVGCD